MKLQSGFLVLLWCLIDHGVFVADTDTVSVMEGDSVTLNTGVQTNQQDKIGWYFNDILIAQINRDQSKICTDVQCNEGNERFRDRLKLDHQTGSLTITNTRNTDAGAYQLRISSGSSDNEKVFIVSVTGAAGVDTDRVSVMEGDSVTLNTGVQTNQQEKIGWYYNDIRVAQINGDQSKTCTDVQCNEDTERFRDRLKLDHQTGSLTITNITDTDSGVYQLRISSGSSDSENTFNVSVHGVSAAERDEVKRKSVTGGEPVTLVPGLTKKPNDLLTWYFNDILIAEITGDLSYYCTDVQCNEGTGRFRDRLKLDHQTGSLTITNTTTEDSGEYKLQINNSRFSILKTFSVTATDSGPSSAVIAGISATAVILLLITVAGIYYRHRRSEKRRHRRSEKRKAIQNGNRTTRNDHPQKTNGHELTALHQPENTQTDAAKRTSLNQTTTTETGPADTEVEDSIREETALNHTDSPQEDDGEVEMALNHTDSPQEDDVRVEMALNHTDSPQEDVAHDKSHMETETPLMS